MQFLNPSKRRISKGIKRVVGRPRYIQVYFYYCLHEEALQEITLPSHNIFDIQRTLDSDRRE
jgi:hypothetical protein